MATKVTALEHDEEVYRCPCCGGYVVVYEERTYDKDEVFEGEKWLEHCKELPSWVDEGDVKTMDIIA